MKIIFIADNFAKYYLGGAELSLQALIEKCPYPFEQVLCGSVFLTKPFTPEDFLIIGNFTDIPINRLGEFKNLNYAVIEHDFKYCEFRSPEKHAYLQGRCDCHNSDRAKKIIDFFLNSRHIFWKSQRQREIYETLFPKLKNHAGTVINCNFSDSELQYIDSIKGIAKDDNYLIYDNPEWHKGRDNAVNYCKEKSLDYIMANPRSRESFLDRLAGSKGLVFLPNGSDTCPRVVIEAKLLGCDLILNDKVLCKDDAWLLGDYASIVNYLKSRIDLFWERIDSLLPCYTATTI